MTDATHKNIMAIKEHSEQTRAMLRALESSFEQVAVLQNDIAALKQQISALQVRVYSGGATA